MGKTIYVPSMVTGAVTAYNTEDGTEKWSFFTEGPVRFAPIAINGKIYVGSDDGFIYCLNGRTGELLWKFQGAPKDRKCIGNKRIISSWPIRGGIVYENGILYFGAGSFPFQGIYIYAVDAESGKKIWVNSSTGSLKEAPQVHAWIGDNGVAIQGYFTIIGEKLIVPTGKAWPAIFDKKTGEFIINNVGHKNPGSFVSGINNIFFHSNLIFGADKGELWYHLKEVGMFDIMNSVVLTSKSAFVGTTKSIIKYDISDIKPNPAKTMKIANAPVAQWLKKHKGKSITGIIVSSEANKVLAKSQNLIIASNQSAVFAIDIESEKVKWKNEVSGTPESAIIANNKLFVVTDTGMLYCYGNENIKPSVYNLPECKLKHNSSLKGYNLVIGIKDEDELYNLPGKVIAIDNDEDKIVKLRRKLSKQSLLGRKISLFCGEIQNTHFPAYFAKKIIVNNKISAKCADKIYKSLHPFGGELIEEGKLTIKRTEGPTGAGWWSHEDGNHAKTLNSEDKLLKGNLGLQWFGGDRGISFKHKQHSHPIRPQVNSGVLIIKNQDGINAYDIYTGELLWKTKLTSVTYKDYIQPGGRVLGGTFVTDKDIVYVNESDKILRFDLNTGKELESFKIDGKTITEKDAEKGNYISLYNNFLVVGTLVKPYFPRNKYMKLPSEAAACKRIIVLDKTTGRELWKTDAENYFFNTAIVIGGDKVFCVDLHLNLYDKVMYDRKANLKTIQRGKLSCFDIKTGKQLWTKDGFGTFFAYSEKNDLLFQSFEFGPRSKRFFSNFFKIETINGKTGAVVWSKPAFNVPYIYHESRNLIFPAMGSWKKEVQKLKAFVMTTGEEREFIFPKRNGGGVCSAMLAAEDIVTFRSTSAAYADLDDLPNKISLNGFRSGCTENLIPAGGLLNCPVEFALGCTCNLPLQTSLALIPTDDN